MDYGMHSVRRLSSMGMDSIKFIGGIEMTFRTKTVNDSQHIAARD